MHDTNTAALEWRTIIKPSIHCQRKKKKRKKTESFNIFAFVSGKKKKKKKAIVFL